MMNLNLALNWRLPHPRIHGGDFFTADSISAFAAAFIDPGPISDHWTYDIPLDRDGIRRTHLDRDRGFGKILSHAFAKRRREMSDLLYKGGGIVVCRLRPRGEALELVSPDGPHERIDRYSFLSTLSLVDRQHQLSFPANARFSPRRGRDVIPVDTDDPFVDYLREFAGRISYSAVYQDILDTPIDRFATVLGHNRVGDVVALSLPFGEGRLVFLPPVDGVPPAREAEVLVEAVDRMVSRPEFIAPPDWISGYSLPGEDKLADELRSLIERRDRLAAKVEEIQTQLEQVAKYKRILYTTGRFTLVPGVRDAFRTLGFTIDDSPYDAVVRSPEGDAIVAVAAADSGPVDVYSYRRLLDWVDRARTAGTGPDKGILVVNAATGLDPKRRKRQFTPEVLRGCKSQGFCLMTSYSLYKLVAAVVGSTDKHQRASVRKKIMECDGEFRG